MKRFIFLVLTFALASSLGLLAQGNGQGGSQRSSKPQGREAQQQTHTRQTEQQQARNREQRRIHECEQLCVKSQEEARNLKRYTERQSFEGDTARQFGQQLHQRLESMDREHQRLWERLSAAEQERQQERLQALEQCRTRWQKAWGEIEKELETDTPNRAELRRQAGAIEKEIKNYQQELVRLEEGLSH